MQQLFPSITHPRRTPYRLARLLAALGLVLATAGITQAANPVLTIQGLGNGGSDVTAFVDRVEIIRVSNGTVVSGAVTNPSFETYNTLSNGTYGYNPSGASWTFTAPTPYGSGITENGSGFTPPTIPDGLAAAFVQSGNSTNGLLQQTLTLPDGAYQVRFLSAQRPNYLSQSLDVLVDGVSVGTVQPPSTTTFTSFTSNIFQVGPLPVQLTTFTAEAVGTSARLRWATASETNNDHFDIEASTDGRSFQRLGSIAGHGSTLLPQQYAYLDENLARYAATLVYYRLRQIDVDGTATYSQVRTVGVGKSGLSLYPNPATHTTTLIGTAPGAQVQVYNMLGSLILTAQADAAGTTTLALMQSLPSGLYLVRSGAGPALRLTIE